MKRHGLPIEPPPGVDHNVANLIAACARWAARNHILEKAAGVEPGTAVEFDFSELSLEDRDTLVGAMISAALRAIVGNAQQSKRCKEAVKGPPLRRKSTRSDRSPVDNRCRGSHKPVTPPPGLHPALARIVEALARHAAREDFARAMRGESDDVTSDDLRPLLKRSPKRSVD